MAWSSSEALRLLNLLAITAASGQSEQVITQSVDNLDQTGLVELSSTARQQLESQLLTSLGSDPLMERTAIALQSLLPSTSADAEAMLNRPLMIRVRNFDAAMEVAGAPQKLQAFSAGLELRPPSVERRKLIVRLDTARRSSNIAALLQTEIDITVTMMAMTLSGQTPVLPIPSLMEQHRVQRQRYMAAVVNRLDLFCYRYMTEDELRQYVQLWEHPLLQDLLDSGIASLQQALDAGRIEAINAMIAGDVQ